MNIGILIFMKNQDSTPFGRRLQKARKDAGLTQQQAAKKISMSQGTLGELERDGKGSSYTAALATLYGVDPLWLATGKGEPSSPGVRGELETRNSDKAIPPPAAKQIGELLLLFMRMRPEFRETLIESAKVSAEASEEQKQQGAI